MEAMTINNLMRLINPLSVELKLELLSKLSESLKVEFQSNQSDKVISLETKVETDTKTDLEKLHELAKQPTPKHIPLEVLAKEQGFSNEKFAQALDNVDDSLFEEDNLEELLETLTR